MIRSAMITKREKNLSTVMIAIQVLITVLSFYLTKFILSNQPFDQREYFFLIIQIIPLWSIFLYKFKLGIIFRATGYGNLIRGYIVMIGLGVAIFCSEFYFISRYKNANFLPYAEYIAVFALLNLFGLLAFKFIFYNFMRYMRRKGRNSRNVVIMANETTIPFIDNFIKAKDWGYHLVAIVSHDDVFKGRYKKAHIVKKQETLNKYVTVNAVDDIFYCLPVNDKSYNLELLLKESEEIGITLHIMQPALNQKHFNKSLSSKQSKYKFITHQTVPKNYMCLKLKDLFDFVFSSFVVIALFPLFGIIALLIKAHDGGPVFFKQERIGLNGRRFTCYKFRSMVVNAEAMLDGLMDKNESDGPTFKIKKDPRITKIGCILRKTSLDELPQFLNVIKGDMSVVGPRPPLLKEVKLYERCQLRRLSMKPGITCTWQVKGRNKVSFQEWMQMDLEYIDNWSLWVDAKLILGTVGVMLKMNGR